MCVCVEKRISPASDGVAGNRHTRLSAAAGPPPSSAPAQRSPGGLKTRRGGRGRGRRAVNKLPGRAHKPGLESGAKGSRQQQIGKENGKMQMGHLKQISSPSPNEATTGPPDAKRLSPGRHLASGKGRKGKSFGGQEICPVMTAAAAYPILRRRRTLF